MNLTFLLIKMACIDHINALNLHYDLFGCGIIAICIKINNVAYFLHFCYLMYYDKLSYGDKIIMIIDRVVKSLSHTTIQELRKWIIYVLVLYQLIGSQSEIADYWGIL